MRRTNSSEEFLNWLHRERTALEEERCRKRIPLAQWQEEE